ncbi:MAG: hypothetical protein JXR52_09640 [Bacteroidales bacterium]|nr:hypothetical protein [Bacteroidales bacterium]
MKNLVPCAVCIFLISACSQTITEPFEADFTGNYVSYLPDAKCGECPVDTAGNPVGPECWTMVINEGSGTSTHLGNFTHYFEFCGDDLSGIYPGDHMIAYFIDENGDTLKVSCAGKVLVGRTKDHPEHVNSYWKDPFVIEGGSGRFEGATGEGMTDDYNSDQDPFSHHHWKGTITLVKGNK